MHGNGTDNATGQNGHDIVALAAQAQETAFSVAAGMAADRLRAIRIEIDLQMARGVPFHEAAPALAQATSALVRAHRGEL